NVLHKPTLRQQLVKQIFMLSLVHYPRVTTQVLATKEHSSLAGRNNESPSLAL
ncbi:hypothetical protein GCK32_012719, partial [Trichostrongylus colubriformis]